MAQWYCMVGGQRYGPISPQTLEQWAQEGRIRPSDSIWREGMPTWVPASTVEGLFVVPPAPPPPIPPRRRVPPPSAGGSGGATPNYALTAQAREALRGNWGLSVAFCLLWALLASAAGSVPFGSLAVSGPLELGGATFFLTLTRGRKPEIMMLFSGFENFFNALLAYLLRAAFVLLWLVGVALPGAVVGALVAALGQYVLGAAVAVVFGFIPGLVAAIVAQLSYAQIFYLMADDPSLGCYESLRKSQEMMRGHKERLFYLSLRYFGWSLLCLLTLGVGFLFLWPYMGAGYARFYEDLLPPAAATPTPVR